MSKIVFFIETIITEYCIVFAKLEKPNLLRAETKIELCIFLQKTVHVLSISLNESHESRLMMKVLMDSAMRRASGQLSDLPVRSKGSLFTKTNE